MNLAMLRDSGSRRFEQAALSPPVQCLSSNTKDPDIHRGPQCPRLTAAEKQPPMAGPGLGRMASPEKMKAALHLPRHPRTKRGCVSPTWDKTMLPT